MARNKCIVIIFLLVLLTGLLTGCGKKEYVVEYGVDGYVYPARLLRAMEGVNDLRIIGDYLYYTQNTDSNTLIRRVPVAAMIAGEGSLDFSRQETLASFSRNLFLLPEDTPEKIQDIDFLDLLENGSSRKSRNMELGKRYGMFSLAGYAADSEGNLYYYLAASTFCDFNMENGGGILGKRTADGQQINWMHLPEMAGIAANGDGRIFVLLEEKILVLDQEGSEVGRISLEEYYNGENEPQQELFMDSEGQVYYSIVNDRYVRKAYEIKEEGIFRLYDAGELLGDGLTNASASSDGNIFLYAPNNASVLYEFNKQNGSAEKVLNWYESGLTSSGVRSVVRITPDILLVNYDGYIGSSGIYQLTRTSINELPEKELLIIASPGSSLDLQRAVTMFNAQSDTYRVILDSYGCEYSYDDMRWITTILDASLVSANPPDILDLNSMNYVKYAEKNILEDLTPYMENSSKLDLEDIPDNMLKGLTFNDRMIGLPMTYKVYCIGGRSSQIGEMESWTMDDIYRFSELHPESKGQLVDDGFGSRKQKEWLIEEFCAHYYLEKFVNWEEGECSFDSEEFRKLLAWAGAYGCEPEPEENSSGVAIFLYPEYIPENSLLVSQMGVNFETLMMLDLQFKEEACLRGYPSADGSDYFSASLSDSLGIVANSAHKDAAWEFLEYYWKANFGKYYINPSKRTIMEKYENITTLETYNGLHGEKEKIKGTISFQGTSTDYTVIPKEQADAILEIIQTADLTPLSEGEEMIIRIVTEEAASYFNGDKSLEEVTAIIQNRAGLVLKERND